ncbi:Txe/YoeB family addiction module toxin [Mucilaginibacter paludis]|uniref:Putative mRNA interferase YoeB n=1 Tax=Mucilaginibacter paludis DSM 18603 TaxID=714943 RepID=H1XZI9_9SPHI|nr:Txe/YoeB family addiction module toxin [Mucilaginibacter paludis]EHQ26633.1 addiction module toxin, Txe/YoeB family [Mucilaginibacter paludis DSM 18603]
MEIEVIFLPKAQADLFHWKKSGNKIIQQRIAKLIQAIIETPFEGIGKPEPLKYDYTGWWSRRINEEHRIVYKVEADKIVVAKLRFHY